MKPRPELRQQFSRTWIALGNGNGHGNGTRTSRQRGQAFRVLGEELRSSRLDVIDRNEDPRFGIQEVINGRLALRNTLRTKKEGNEGRERYVGYLAELIDDARETYFANQNWGIVVIIDNIDQMSYTAQRTIRFAMKPVMRRANIRTIVMMRQSSWRMSVTDGFAMPVDVAPHCGPTPLEAVIGRLERLTRANLADYGVAASHDTLNRYITFLLDRLRSSSRLSAFFVRTCGFSIRKAFVLAQYLLTSPMLSLKDFETLSDHHLKRFMICGPNRRYRWTLRSVLDNPFALHAKGPPVFLIKLRIIRILWTASAQNPVTVGALVEHLNKFGYSSEQTRHALNEMMVDTKRLIWTDSLLQFETPEIFGAVSRSAAFLARSGTGLWELTHDLDYVQEMILDTVVNANEFKDIKYDSVVARLDLIERFLRMLWRQDLAEVTRFAETYPYEEYLSVLPSLGGYITSAMIRECATSALAVLSSLAGQVTNQTTVDRLANSLRTLFEDVGKDIETAWVSPSVST